ncbi:MAG: hypothetical protein LLG24_07900 [Actinomycetia bacterium]|nr:hypothetical protein [Actinomycetes bacterium]
MRSKADAEIKDAEALVEGASRVRTNGGPFAGVMLVKGEPGVQDVKTGVALGGDDGEAARKALAALGYQGAVMAVVSRPLDVVRGPEAGSRVRLLAEASEASIVIALDARAAEDVAAAFGLTELAFGVLVQAVERTLLAVDGLEASLTDQARKRRVWQQFRALSARPVPTQEQGADGRPAGGSLF